MSKTKTNFSKMVGVGVVASLMFIASYAVAANSNLNVSLLRVSTTGDSMSCGNSVGDDGLYSGCVGDTITHTPTGIKFTVVSYTDGNAVLSTSLNLKSGGTIRSLSLNKNVPVLSTLTDGTEIKTTYTETDSKYGAFIQISSIIPIVMSCGNSAGDDGLYSGCAGDTITHNPTGIKFKVVSYTDGNAVLSTSLSLKSGGTIQSLSLNKNVPVASTLSDGTKITTTYTETDSKYGAFVKISSSCLNSSGDDGLYRGCVGNTITHNPTGIKLNVVSYTDSNLVLSTSLDLKSGGTIRSLSLNKNVPVVSTLTNGTEFTTKYTEMDSERGASIQISSTLPIVMSCGNSAGNDGLYSGCAGDTITHNPTGIKFKVVSYTEGNAVIATSLSLKSGGTIQSLSLNKNVPVLSTLTDGTEITTIYTETDSKYGAFIKISSKIPTTTNSTVSTTPATSTTSTTSTPAATPAVTPAVTPAKKTVEKKPVTNNYEDEVITADYGKNPFLDTDMSTLLGQAAFKLHSLGIIGGYPDGEFKGSRPVNRAEAAKFLVIGLYGKEQLPDISNNGKFWDILDGQWYTPFIMTAYEKGIMSGYSDRSIRPANTVNTAEFLKMLTLTFGLEQNITYHYSDVPSDAWYSPYAGIAEKYKLFPNRSDRLLPASLLTREEVAIAIYNYFINK